jgi:hypothetical protein
VFPNHRRHAVRRRRAEAFVRVSPKHSTRMRAVRVSQWRRAGAGGHGQRETKTRRRAAEAIRHFSASRRSEAVGKFNATRESAISVDVRQM